MNNRYPWPASGLSRQDMALLHDARETLSPRRSISALLAEAVRFRFAANPGSGASPADPIHDTQKEQ
jgi:hypothetical protein